MSTTTEAPNVAAVGTVGFNRKVSVRQYESAEASIFVQFDIPTDPSLSDEARGAQLLANAKAAFFQAKALVYEELGLEFEVGDDGVVRELVNKTFSGPVEVVNTTAVEAPSAPAADDVSATPPFSSETKDKSERAANKAWAQKRYASHPQEFFDNRPKKAAGEYSPKSPDVKHKASGVALWLD